MREFDSSELRARVICDFVSVSRDVTDANEMNRLADAVMINAMGAVREMLHVFNGGTSVARVPPGVLASCFAQLPFRCRISPSQVCRSWRAAALSAPKLWSHIGPYSPSNSPGFLQMALSRAGALPIYMKLKSGAPASPEAIYTAIAAFSPQIRYLSWHLDQPISPWESSAPLMECFCSSRTITITDRFLGGRAGQLRCLYLQYVQLPAECPVLATVCELSVALTPYEDDVAPSTLGNLFDLFPRLEFLNIHGITRRASHLLPAGPAPVSLTELWLHSRTMDHDLVPYYLAYDSGNIRRVWLEQGSDTRPDLECLASGAVRLAVNHLPDTSTTSLMIEHSPTVYHSMSIDIPDAAALLIAVQSSLSEVHTAMVSHTALEPIVGLLAALPKLEHLFVHIVSKNGSRRPRVFVWTHLSCLSALGHIPRITLHVWCGNNGRPAVENAEHARGLIAQLRTLPGTLPPIEIQGFVEEQLTSLDVTGLNVRFDVSAKASDLVLHKRREPYDPLRYDENWDC